MIGNFSRDHHDGMYHKVHNEVTGKIDLVVSSAVENAILPRMKNLGDGSELQESHWVDSDIMGKYLQFTNIGRTALFSDFNDLFSKATGTFTVEQFDANTGTALVSFDNLADNSTFEQT